MSKTLADMDMAEAEQILSQCGPAAMYNYMADFGDKYAVLANGVARGGSLSGNAALRHMRAVAEKSGKKLSEQDVGKIRLDMAKAYLNVRNTKSEHEEYTQLSAREAQEFHRDVFTRNNLPEKAWTLETPFNMWGEKGRETLWQDILNSAGTYESERNVSAEVFLKMVAIQQGFSQTVSYNPLGGIFSPDTYKRDLETLHDATEWLGINTSFENFKETLFGPEQPESPPETLECVIDPPAIDAEAPVPAPQFIQMGEPLKKSDSFISRSAAFSSSPPTRPWATPYGR